jgi:hypothetical protein
MKGDFTDVRRWPSKRYTSVRMQQGRVQLDSDWNEAVEITDHRERSEAIDVIGQAGAPKLDPGFIVAAAAGNTDLTISKGHFYVDGILCELDAATTYATQPDLPKPPFVTNWGANNAALALPDGLYLAYLDAWERHVTALDDAALREPALGGADTTTRTKLIQQVKLLAVTPPNATPTCETVFPEWTALVTPNPAIGRLSAQSVKTASTPGPCSVEAQAGYSGLENQLYRVEIHTGGAAGVATFKWSRENGSIAALVKPNGQSGDDLTIEPVPGVTFAKGDWIEVIDDGRELRGEPGVLVRLADVQGAKLTLDPATQDPPAPVLNLADQIGRTKVRRWEVASASATTAQTAVAGAPTWKTLEQRVQVSFEANRSWPTGAWWVVPARVALGDVVWPLDGGGNPVLQPSLGIRHHYARLALVRKSGATLTVTSCAKKFPPLTAIAASDVSFDDTICQSGSKTVQQAIDHLCQEDRACCEITVSPEGDWVGRLNADLAQVTSASICFRAGHYQLAEPLVIKGKTSIKVTGAGPGTEIVAPTRETALAFESCGAVVVRDVMVSGGTVQRAASDPRPRLNGALDFRDCGEVLVEDAVVHSDSDPERHASAIAARRSRVRVRACRVFAGFGQVGVLVVDGPRAVIEDNVITVVPGSAPDIRRVLRNERLRGGVREGLVSHLAFGEAPAREARPARRLLRRAIRRGTDGTDATPAPAPARDATPDPAPTGETELARAASDDGSTVRLRLGGRDVAFRSDLPQATWNEVVRALPLAGDVVEGEIREYLRAAGEAILVGEGRDVAGHAIAGLGRWFADLVAGVKVNAASQGVVIAGRTAPDVQVRGNTITGVRQAIHVGVSHASPTRTGTPDRAGRVVIADNVIEVTVLTAVRGARHGIFVGNVDSLRIEDNRITSRRPGGKSRRSLEGIRVYGFVGRHAVVQQNHIAGCDTGVFFNAVNDKADGSRSIWRARDNMAESASIVVDEGVTSNLTMTGNKG